MARRQGHTDEQILAALWQAESGATVAEVCRQMSIAEQTFYVYKRKMRGWVSVSCGNFASSVRKMPS
jgi:transposase-like protein